MSPRPSRAWPTLLLALALLAGSGCKTRWEVEDRESAAEVWLEVPAAAQGEVSLPITVTVGESTVVNRVVRFPLGQTRVAVPPAYLRTGNYPVTVSIGGQVVATGQVGVQRYVWILVRIVGGQATILPMGREPGTR